MISRRSTKLWMPNLWLPKRNFSGGAAAIIANCGCCGFELDIDGSDVERIHYSCTYTINTYNNEECELVNQTTGTFETDLTVLISADFNKVGAPYRVGDDFFQDLRWTYEMRTAGQIPMRFGFCVPTESGQVFCNFIYFWTVNLTTNQFVLTEGAASTNLLYNSTPASCEDICDPADEIDCDVIIREPLWEWSPEEFISVSQPQEIRPVLKFFEISTGNVHEDCGGGTYQRTLINLVLGSVLWRDE